FGLHLEGPWINPEKRGAHVEQFIRKPELKKAEELLSYGTGVIKMITLAPEVCSRKIIELIGSHGIIISAGHSNATYKQAIQGFHNGITSVTHLYNAMSSLHHREPGLVGAAFNHERVMCSIIPDGYHTNFAAVAIAKKIIGDRLFVITDAVAESFEGLYKHHLQKDYYVYNGILSGSALTMHKAFINLIRKVEIDVDEALRMCSLYPAKALNCADRYGKIAPGYAVQFAVLNDEFQLTDVICE
ncbi:MAG: N-acetylglucosamine-6-phosphate deacetylase, partial [Chitinophagaceae bacterium]|nr:N-acetylglucosamine-6-phosphate deacetylase [Chitinophagaceae bacterium]